MKTKTNSFQYLLQQLASVGLLDKDMVDKLREKRFFWILYLFIGF